MNRHHHHAQGSVVVAGLVALAGLAVAAYAAVRSKAMNDHLHDDVGKLMNFTDANFRGVAAAVSHVAEVVNNNSERLENTIQHLIPGSPESREG